jgi:hypothetical protein
MSDDEVAANDAMRWALQDLRTAQAAAERAGYGSLVLGPLSEALKAAQYALDIAEGKF